MVDDMMGAKPKHPVAFRAPMRWRSQSDMVFVALATGFFTLRRSNNASKAVIAVVGSAAACA
ncbi:hypothetical protein X756_27730 [Mesorhizobium sp. LSHC412B00]|nr:hypothetical protein X756_27730 [Mesorhizobium sp. LSHC412B00]